MNSDSIQRQVSTTDAVMMKPANRGSKIVILSASAYLR